MRTILLLSLALVFLSASAAHARVEIAVFDLQKVAAESDALKGARDAMENKFGKQKTELEKERDALEKKAVEYQKKAPTEKQRQEFLTRQREYSEKAQAFMRLLQADELRVRKDIEELIGRSAGEFAQRKGYALLLDVAAVPWFDPELDVTAAILAEINERWKKESGGSPSEPAESAQPASGK